MAGQAAADGERDGRHFQRVLLVVWCCFIVYGSLVPFRFSADPDFARSNLAKVPIVAFQAGTKNFSLSDVVANVLLFIPFGLLLAGSGFRAVGRGWLRRICAIGALAFGLAVAIELGQLFSAGRRASGIDVEFDVLGALVGSVGAYLLQRYEKQAEAWLHAARAEPRLVPIVLLALWLGSDAFYPFAVTLDVSTAWHNLRHAKWVPFREPQGFWLDRVVDEAVMFAMLSALMRSTLVRHISAVRAAVWAVCAAVAFSVALEAGKLLVVGRLPNVENVLLASAGAGCGVTLAPLLMAWPPVRRRLEWLLAVLSLLLLVYSELTPFAFALSSSAVATNTGRIEWMPLLSYSRADVQSALFDLWRKLVLSGFWGFSLALASGATPGRVTCAGLLVGAVLEATQLLTPGRVPSVGDALVFALGAWIGAAVYTRSSLCLPAREEVEV
jgi:VanZ family protein